MLDRERPIAFSNRALYQLGELPSPPDLKDLKRPGKAYNALLKFIWACLVETDHPFKEPADLADYITPDNAGDAAEAFARALGGELERDQKKTAGSVPGPLPGSNSG